MKTPLSSIKGTALVTGASRGIGRVVALRLAGLGYRVGVNYRTGRDQANEVVAQVHAQGGTAAAIGADLANASEVRRLWDQTEEVLGPVSVLVNNAGITRDKLLVQMSPDDWDATWMTDLDGPRALLSRAVESLTARAGGRVINISSVVGAAGNAGQANYAAAKAALMGLTREFSVVAAVGGVTVNCVVPGYIITDATAHLNEAQNAGWLKRIPLGRYAAAEEVAALVAFLASDEASYITGQCIAIDGGFLAAQGAGIAP